MIVTDDRLTTREAAIYVGYRPGVDAEGKPLPLAKDKAVRAFYAWVHRHHVAHKRRGRTGMLFLPRDLDRALDRSTDEQQQSQQSRFDRMAALARQHARGELSIA